MGRSVSAVWLWDVPGAPGAVVRFVRERRVREVFVNGADRRAGEQCAALRSGGVSASCLGGEPGWVLDPNAGIDWCRAALSRTGGTALHLDVEPWALPEWADDAVELAAAYADFVERCARELDGPAIEVDIVPWLFAEAPQTARRVLRAVGSATILGYRDRAQSIRDFAEPAIAAARELRRPYRIGVETAPIGPGVPPGTTFADDGAAVLRRELRVLAGGLADDRWYRGVAVHHWNSWRTLDAADLPEP